MEVLKADPCYSLIAQQVAGVDSICADIEEEWLVEFGGFYSVLKHPIGKEGRQFLTLLLIWSKWNVPLFIFNG